MAFQPLFRLGSANVPGSDCGFRGMAAFWIGGAAAGPPPIPPIPPIPPEPDSHGFGGGGGWFDPRLARERGKRRRKKFDDDCAERAELANELRQALYGDAEPPVVSESTAIRLNIDPKISGLLARADDAPAVEARALVARALIEVEAAIRDEDDVECLLMGM